MRWIACLKDDGDDNIVLGVDRPLLDRLFDATTLSVETRCCSFGATEKAATAADAITGRPTIDKMKRSMVWFRCFVHERGVANSVSYPFDILSCRSQRG
jgi:hypothetical protein